MKESSVERRFRDYCAKHGFWCLKLIPSGLIGFPDRTILGPGPTIYFIEFKTATGKLSPHQRAIKTTLETFGFKYYICRTYEEAKQTLVEATQRAEKSN